MIIPSLQVRKQRYAVQKPLSQTGFLAGGEDRHTQGWTSARPCRLNQQECLLDPMWVGRWKGGPSGWQGARRQGWETSSGEKVNACMPATMAHGRRLGKQRWSRDRKPEWPEKAPRKVSMHVGIAS